MLCTRRNPTVCSTVIKLTPPPQFLPQISILPISSALSLWFLQRVSGYKNFIFTFGEDCFLSLLQTEGARDKTLVSSWSAIYLKGKHLTLAHVRLFLKAGDGSSLNALSPLFVTSFLSNNPHFGMMLSRHTKKKLQCLHSKYLVYLSSPVNTLQWCFMVYLFTDESTVISESTAGLGTLSPSLSPCVSKELF